MTTVSPTPLTPPPAPAPSPEFALVKQAILDSLQGELTALNLAVVVTAAMRVLRKQSKLSGPQKKALLIEVLDAVLTEQGMDDTERAQLMFIVPSLVDQLYSVGKQGLGGGCCSVL
jgi:hypothetical protein